TRSPSPSGLAADVGRAAAKSWSDYQKRVAKFATLDILQDLARTSIAEMPKLLATDRKVGRTNLAKAASAYREQIVTRLATGAMALAEIWKRETGMEFDEKKFYSFEGSPAFIAVPSATPSSAKD
ncbi:MAG: hypothetical protein AAB250_01940, partial [Bdellovibrionota bacterium]